MFFRRNQRSDRQPSGSPARRRPASYRPGLESLEDRCLPSGSSLGFTDTLSAAATGAGVAGANTFYYNMRGALAGQRPGAVSSHVLYNGVLGHGTNRIAGGAWSETVSGSRAVAGTLQGTLAGGSIVWSTSGKGGAVTITITITGGTGAYAGDTGTATLHGTIDRASQTLSGTLSVSLTHHSSSPPPTQPPPPTSSSETLNATGGGAGIAGSNTFFYDLHGSLTGKVAGAFAARVYYTGVLGSGTNTITGGNWSLAIPGAAGTSGSLQGRFAGGSIVWSADGRAGTVTVSFTITGGTGAYAGDTGTATFHGTMDWYSEAIAGTLTLSLK